MSQKRKSKEHPTIEAMRAQLVKFDQEHDAVKALTSLVDTLSRDLQYVRNVLRLRELTRQALESRNDLLEAAIRKAGIEVPP
jgi:hypothetical protein